MVTAGAHEYRVQIGISKAYAPTFEAHILYGPLCKAMGLPHPSDKSSAHVLIATKWRDGLENASFHRKFLLVR